MPDESTAIRKLAFSGASLMELEKVNVGCVNGSSASPSEKVTLVAAFIGATEPALEGTGTGAGGMADGTAGAVFSGGNSFSLGGTAT